VKTPIDFPHLTNQYKVSKVKTTEDKLPICKFPISFDLLFFFKE